MSIIDEQVKKIAEAYLACSHANQDELISAKLRAEYRLALTELVSKMVISGELSTTEWRVKCDDENNPPSELALNRICVTIVLRQGGDQELHINLPKDLGILL